VGFIAASLYLYFCCVCIQFFSLLFVHTMRVHIFFVSQPNSHCLVNHISVVFGVIQPSWSLCSFSCRFCLSTWLLVFYLGHFVCHIGLLCSFSDNFVCCLSLLDQGCSFDAAIYVIITLSFHYLPFAVVHHVISSRYMPFAVVTYIVSSASLN
jgi:hypothetical protein